MATRNPGSLRISGKNMDIGNSLRQHIEDRINDAVDKYFDGGFSGHVTVEKEGSAGFHAECSVHLDTGINLQTSAKHSDATPAFDAAAEKIEKRLRRYKRRLKDHHGQGHKDASDAAAFVLQTPDEHEELPDDYAPIIIAETQTPLRKMAVGTAVMHLDLTEAPVVVFTNPSNGAVNVVYRRPDGNIGWIDPSEAGKTN